MNDKKIPLRSCIISKEKLPKKDLIRIVKNNKDEVFVDLTGKQNGHGIYIKKDKTILQKAKTTKLIDKKLGITIPENIYEELEKIIEN